MATAMDLEDERIGPGLPWSLAAGSWRDATRVAAADPDLWGGIFAFNRAPVLAALDRWLGAITEFRSSLAAKPGRRASFDSRAIARKRRRLSSRLEAVGGGPSGVARPRNHRP